jgi:cytochrome c-type biogenesis protein CcmF
VIVELGHLALSVALAASVALAMLGLGGAARGDAAWMRFAPRLVAVQAATVTLAFGALTWAFVHTDFSVALVAGYAHSALPLVYRYTAVWGNHEGSMLLWVWVLAGWTLAVAWRTRSACAVQRARVLGVMGLIGVGFLAFLLFTSNPFLRAWPVPADGQGMNPLLQDPGMVWHPPLLYMGYVGLVVAFAYTVAGLLQGELGSAWARAIRPWTLVAWAFLTVGIALGSFWAYYELGWGGWWFWDPVENASFMPWLVATALLHSAAMADARGSFRLWTALLALLGFALALLGTFIVRSGVLSSVHAFASDPGRGLFILVFLALVVGGALALYAWRAPTVGVGASFQGWSREGLLFGQTLLLMVAAASVLLGTLYPMLLDAMGLGKLSVGPPYFEAVFVPLMLLVMLLMVPGPVLAWRRAAGRAPWRAWMLVAGLAVGAATAVVWWVPGASWATWGGLALAAWLTFGVAQHMVQWWRQRLPASARWRALRGAKGGMWLAHLGVAVFALGVAAVSTWGHEQDVRLRPGQAIAVGNVELRFDGVTMAPGPNYFAVRARLPMQQHGQTVTTLEPERRLYLANGQTMTEVAIDRSLWRDVYVALGESLGNDAFAFRVHHKPLVNWIWLGCLMMALGGLMAAFDRRAALPPAQAA